MKNFIIKEKMRMLLSHFKMVVLLAMFTAPFKKKTILFI